MTKLVKDKIAYLLQKIKICLGSLDQLNDVFVRKVIGKDLPEKEPFLN